MIFCIAPNAVHISGGVGVLANWVRLLNQRGHDAMLITPNGDPSPFWLNFQVPTGSYSDLIDSPEHKRVDIWMDCMREHQTGKTRNYFFAQDVCQLQHIMDEWGWHRYEQTRVLLQSHRLITITNHAKWFYLYRHGMKSKVVNNFVDTELFKPGDTRADWVAMVKHRDHYSWEIHQMLTQAGFAVKIAQGTQAEVAATLSQCLFFVSDVRGRWDGFEYSEGMPMPILEAMASGCVTLCRDTNGVREFVYPYINACAFYKDIAGLMNTMEAIKGPWPWPDMSIPDMARRTFVNHFSEYRTWNQIQEALELT
jgi:glycosyltransferase involved in cell wall biosynthesis